LERTRFSEELDDGDGGWVCLTALPADDVCPITLEPMLDPVMAADGHTYERRAIEDWFKMHNRSPMTNEHMPHTLLLENPAARRIDRLIDEVQDADDEDMMRMVQTINAEIVDELERKGIEPVLACSGEQLIHDGERMVDGEDGSCVEQKSDMKTL